MNYYSDEEYQEDLKDAREYEERKLKIEQDEHLKNMEAAEQLKKRDLDEAFTIMKQELDNWWD